MSGRQKGWEYGDGTWMETRMFMSKAFLSLNGTAAKILILFLGKRKFEKGKDKKGQRQLVCTNQNELTMTYIELESPPFNFTRPRISRAIDDLLAKGFIEIKDPGGAYKRHKAVYALSDQWRHWQPGMVVFKRSQDSCRGYQGRRIGMTS